MSSFKVRASVELVIQARDIQEAKACATELLTRRVEGQAWGVYKDYQGEIIAATLLDEWEKLPNDSHGSTYVDSIEDRPVEGGGD